MTCENAFERRKLPAYFPHALFFTIREKKSQARK